MSLLDTDLLILKFFNQPFLQDLNILFIFLVFLVYPYLIFLLYYYFKTKNNRKLFHLIIASILGYFFVIALKFLINRPRPYETFSDINATLLKIDPSFPSSHAFLAFLLTYFIPRKFSKAFFSLSILYLVLLIPMASMYIGVHYPSDLLVGALIGLIFPRLISENLSSKILKKLSVSFS